MSDTVKLRVGMEVNYIAGSTQEDVVDTGITRSEWNAMTEEQRDKIREDYAEIEVSNHVDAWAIVVDDE